VEAFDKNETMKPISTFLRRLWCVLCVAVVWLPLKAVAQPEPVVESLHFLGNEDIATRLLKMQMGTKASPWYDFMPFVKPRRFDAGLFDSDLQRLQTFYQSQGYFLAAIDTTFRVTETGHLFANVRIDEGPRSRVGMLQVLGVDRAGVENFRELEYLKRLEGQPFVEARLSALVADALRRLRNEGYAFAKADVSTYTDSLLVHGEVVFALGPVCEVSEIQISGNMGIPTQTIRQGMTFGEGGVFNGKQLDDSRRQLYRAGVFRAVLIELPDTIAQQTPVRVRVSERPFKSVTLGGGYDTEVGLRASAAWLHRNFGGSARQLRLSSVLSTESRELVAGIREPYFLGSRNWLNLSGFVQKRKQGEVQQNEVGGSASFERNVTERLDFVVQLSGGLVGSQRDSAFSEVRAALRWDTRDDLFDPQQGTLVSLTLRERGWWLQSDWEFGEVTAEGRWFQPLPLQSVLATRLLGGAIFRINTRGDVPGIERYYSGGLNSVRGWNYQELGPKEITVDGNTQKDVVVPFGGTRHLEGSVELRTRVLSFLGTALFVDAANVAGDFTAFSVLDLQWAMGGGLRLLTPVGPVRFDVGYRISDDPVLDNHMGFDSRWRFHLSLGQAF
jgi:outer membrane protein insertion porin family